MNPAFEAQLIERLKNAHRIEASVQLLLAHMTEDASDPATIQQLAGYGLQTRHHKQRLLERLQSHGESAPDDWRPLHASSGSLLIARLIASYELLEATATGAGDFETARVAGLNRSEDQAFVGALFADHFDLLHAVP
jgi:ferritin-like metal-binding protein YciE